MSNRIKGVLVSFEDDMFEEDVESIINAIKSIRFVDSVEKCVTDSNDWFAREHVKSEIREKLLELYNNI